MENRVMATDVIIGHFLKCKDDISTIVNSPKFIDTVISTDDDCYFSNRGNTVFHWSRCDDITTTQPITEKLIREKLEAFTLEISELTKTLDFMEIDWSIIYGANTWNN
jgi:hypothetical protein